MKGKIPLMNTINRSAKTRKTKIDHREELHTPLSLKAVGIYEYLRQHPNTAALEMAEVFKDGYKAIMTGLKELKAAGILESEQERNLNQFGGYVYRVKNVGYLWAKGEGHD